MIKKLFKSITETFQLLVEFYNKPSLEKESFSFIKKLDITLNLFGLSVILKLPLILLINPIKNWFFEINDFPSPVADTIDGNLFLSISFVFLYAFIEEGLFRACFTENTVIRRLLATPVLMVCFFALLHRNQNILLNIFPAVFCIAVYLIILAVDKLENYKVLRILLILSAISFGFIHMPSYNGATNMLGLTILFCLPHIIGALVYNFARIRLGLFYAALIHFVYNVMSGYQFY